MSVSGSTPTTTEAGAFRVVAFDCLSVVAFRDAAWVLRPEDVIALRAALNHATDALPSRLEQTLSAGAAGEIPEVTAAVTPGPRPELPAPGVVSERPIREVDDSRGTAEAKAGRPQNEVFSESIIEYLGSRERPQGFEAILRAMKRVPGAPSEVGVLVRELLKHLEKRKTIRRTPAGRFFVN